MRVLSMLLAVTMETHQKTPLGDTNCDGAGMLQKRQRCQEFFHVLGLAPDLPWTHPAAQQGPCWMDNTSPMCWFLTLQMCRSFSLCAICHDCLLLAIMATAFVRKAAPLLHLPIKGSIYRCKNTDHYQFQRWYVTVPAVVPAAMLSICP